MDPVEILLELGPHCIETAVKRCHERLVKACLKARGRNTDREEKQIRVLTHVLENTDFSRMRSLSPVLSQGQGRVILSATSDLSAIGFRVHGRTFALVEKNQKR